MIAELVSLVRGFVGWNSTPTASGPNAVDPVIASVVHPEPIRTLSELVEDMLCDPMAVMTLGVFLAHIKRADVSINVENGDTDAKAAAIQSDLLRLWLDTLEKLTDMRNGVFTWGGLPFELVEENAFVDAVPVTRIREFKQLPKLVDGEQATERVLSSEGGFGGIRVTIKDVDFLIPPEQSAWFAIGATPLSPHGQSVFYGAPQAVRKRRKETDNLIDVFVSKWALRGPVIHAPAVAYDKNDQPVNNHELIAAQLVEGRAGAGMIFPNTPAGPGMEGKYAIDVTHETGTLDAAPIKIIDDLIDAKMSRAFGVHESVTMDSETGSYASATVRMFVVLSKCDGYVSQLTTQFREIIERAYLPKNYLEGQLPKLTVAPVSLITDGLLADLVKSILAMPTWGPLLESGAVDVATILQGSGIPVAADVVERIDTLLEKIAADKEAAKEQFAQQEQEDEDENEDEDDPLF